VVPPISGLNEVLTS